MQNVELNNFDNKMFLMIWVPRDIRYNIYLDLLGIIFPINLLEEHEISEKKILLKKIQNASKAHLTMSEKKMKTENIKFCRLCNDY